MLDMFRLWQNCTLLNGSARMNGNRTERLQDILGWNGLAEMRQWPIRPIYVNEAYMRTLPVLNIRKNCSATTVQTW